MIEYESDTIFYDLAALGQDEELVRAVKACVAAQRQASGETVGSRFTPNPRAREEVSADALEAILRDGKDVNGIRTDRHISNVIVFNDATYANAVLSDEVARCRAMVDALVQRRLRALFARERDLLIYGSGFFLYPPGGYMGWHTNSQAPGWRLYISAVEEPGKSFFRYRDPVTGGLVTSFDDGVNFRLFQVTDDALFWHAIYSETYRFSIGYTLKRRPREPLLERLMDRLRRNVHRPRAAAST